MFAPRSLEKRIERFWNWFQANCGTIHSPSREPIKGLSKQLSKIQKGLAWACSTPKDDEAATLEISPDGRHEFVEAARRTVALAPAIEGWKFVAFRQPSKDFMIEMMGRRIGVGDCKVVLTIDRDDTKFLQPFLPDGFDQRTMDGLTPILLDHALGEEFVLYFELLHPLPISEAPPDAIPLEELADDIAHSLKGK